MYTAVPLAQYISNNTKKLVTPVGHGVSGLSPIKFIFKMDFVPFLVFFSIFLPIKNGHFSGVLKMCLFHWSVFKKSRKLQGSRFLAKYTKFSTKFSTYRGTVVLVPVPVLAMKNP